MKKKPQLGDMITVKVKRHDHVVEVRGKINGIRRSYGFLEYLVTDGLAEDFWVRTFEKVEQK